MGIRVNYGVPVATAGEIAYQGGLGMFAQEQDKFNLQQDALTQKESQFARGLSFKQELAMLENRQRQDRLDQQGYQFERNLQANQYDRQANRNASLQRMGLQDFYGREAEGRRDTRLQEQEGRRDERLISQEERRRKEHIADRKYEQEDKEAVAIANFARTARPEQAEQVIGEWEQRTGREFNYPSEYDNRRTAPDFGTAKQGIIDSFGGTQEEGGYYLPGDETTYINPDGSEVYDPPIAKEMQLKTREMRRKEWDAAEASADVAAENNASRERIASASATAALEREVEAVKKERQKEVRKRAEDRLNEELGLLSKIVKNEKEGTSATMDKEQRAQHMAKYDAIIGQESLPGQGITRAAAREQSDGWHGMIDGRMGTVETRNGVKGINWD